MPTNKQMGLLHIDIKGAFFKGKVSADMKLIVKMGGELAELFVNLTPA